MKLIVPPPTTRAVDLEDDGPDWLRLRLRQITLTGVTVAVTAWACTFGMIATVFALAVAKHVLVAILVMNVGIDRR